MLQFRQDGTFKIVQFTDVHWQDGGKQDQRSMKLMENVLDAEKPDLVVYTGDTVYSPHSKDACRAFREAVSAAENRGIRWAAVFGNHDAEYGVTKEQLMQVQLQSAYCVSEGGPEQISGIGNFVLQITGRDNRSQAALFFLDSGDYSPLEVGGYDWIRRDQIDWVVKQSECMSDQAEYTLPSLFFFHIPLPEYKEVWDSAVCFGHRYEDVCSPRVNSGLFAALLEMGGVMGTFVGHDHVNDYWGSLHGIRLCYGRATGYNTYGRDGFPRGARVIHLKEGAESFDTWLRLDDGTKVDNQPKHRP